MRGNLYKYAENSDWFLHEAFCLSEDADIRNSYEKHHSTVKNLVLYHTEDRRIKNRKELYSAEGRQYYHRNLYIPDDLEGIVIGG